MLKHGDAAFEHVRNRRRAVDENSRRQIATDTGLTSGLRALPDREVSRHRRLSAQNHIIFQRAASRDGDLSAQDTVLPNDHVVGHLHQIVDFGPFTNQRPAESRTVNGAVGANFHVVFKHNVSNLRYFL